MQLKLPDQKRMVDSIKSLGEVRVNRINLTGSGYQLENSINIASKVRGCGVARSKTML